MNQPLITIYLPTYNRHGLLREALWSVYRGCNVALDLFEVLVSDNCSSDSTREIVQEFQQANFRYHRNAENIGPERNFYQSAILARGRYVLVLGDDDALCAGFLERVLEILSVGSDLLILNYYLYSADMSVSLGTNYKTIHDMKLTSRDSLLEKFGPFLGFISGVVFKREVLLATSEAEYCKYADFGFSFLYAIYAGLAEPCRVAYVSTPLVKQRCDNSNIPNYTKFFIHGHFVVTEALLGLGYSSKAVRASRRISIRKFFLPKLIKDMVHDVPIRAQAKEILKLYRRELLDLMLVSLLLVIPKRLMKLVNNARKAVRSSNAISS